MRSDPLVLLHPLLRPSVCWLTGSCIVAYWRYGTWLGAINCPICRQMVRHSLNYLVKVDADLFPSGLFNCCNAT